MKRQKGRNEIFIAMMQRFTMVPTQHMQQPLFNFGTLNSIDTQGSCNRLASVYGTKSAAFSPIWSSTYTTATSNNNTPGDVLDHFIQKTQWYS